VQDQIRLWELERNRIKTQEGNLGSFYAFVLVRNNSTVLLARPQASCTPRSRPKPTTNTSSATHGSWASSYGKIRPSAASLVASRATRIFVGLSNDVRGAVDSRPATRRRRRGAFGESQLAAVQLQPYADVDVRVDVDEESMGGPVQRRTWHNMGVDQVFP
jgi:Transcription factor Tfb2 (p52) C-terminal domain